MRNIGLVIIGDEILSGKRQDKHLGKVIDMLDLRGLELSWVRVLGDDPVLLTDNLKQTFADDDIVFSCGGIGATPDDRTRRCAADALGVELEVHPQGRTELLARFGDSLNDQRLKLVEFPAGANIIPNPVNRVPGFSIHHHHFVPGFPSMAWPMIEWVLDQHYLELHAPGSRSEEAIKVWDARESDVIPMLEDFGARYNDLRLSCLPASSAGRYHLELGLRGTAARVDEAMDELQTEVAALGFSFEPVAIVRDH